ncbi:phosphatase PAP2 family protein [Halosolutus amylolyticus]|uniref:Phosphatase PAP2 family protein n=1 Tax=Halosolutus amylolyticus TaxID=2932267 RepID=A0ABD5PT93_9EURY|nr:phosphatase PAP2 family protein [Halosolutus amylolyticus]
MVAEELAEVLMRVLAAVAVMLVLSIVVFIGRDRLVTTRREWWSRLRTSAPIIAVLLVVLGLNRVMRQVGPSISREIGIHVSWLYWKVEGEFVLIFQDIAFPELTTYFSLVYVYGYTFLLIFPIVAYFALSDTRPFRQLLAAYSFNYAIGVTLYILIFAYGPRNYIPALVSETMLYDNSPQYIYLTTEVNRNVNVFPSLHTSLATTVAIFAYRTRDEYGRWFPVALLLAVSVVISTMYLGIHWAIDVVGGLVLATLSVVLADRLVDRGLLARLRARLAAIWTAATARLTDRT